MTKPPNGGFKAFGYFMGYFKNAKIRPLIVF